LGLRIATLTNGSAAMSEQMFADAGLPPLLEHRLDVATPGRWKPHRAAWEYVAEECRTVSRTRMGRRVDRVHELALMPR
jgi:2-haloacid dehalogenase